MASRFQDRAPMQPLVSVIIAAYHSGPLLCETVESALGQTWAYREIIVVDDGSTEDLRARLAPTCKAGEKRS